MWRKDKKKKQKKPPSIWKPNTHPFSCIFSNAWNICSATEKIVFVQNSCKILCVCSIWQCSVMQHKSTHTIAQLTIFFDSLAGKQSKRHLPPLLGVHIIIYHRIFLCKASLQHPLLKAHFVQFHPSCCCFFSWVSFSDLLPTNINLSPKHLLQYQQHAFLPLSAKNFQIHLTPFPPVRSQCFSSPGMLFHHPNLWIIC